MKMRVLLMAALLTVAGSAAHAETVNLLNLAPVMSGSFVVNADEMGMISSEALGRLAAKSKITFSYNVSESLGSGITVASSLGYTPDSTAHLVAAKSTNGLVENSDTLVIASANVDLKNGFAQTVVTNLTDVALSMKSSFFSFFRSSLSNVTVSYSVAAVPLPAALPLFGTALAGIAMLRRRNKAKA